MDTAIIAGYFSRLLDSIYNSALTYLPRITIAIILSVFGFILIKIIKNIVSGILNKTKFDRTLEVFLGNVVVALLWILLSFTVLAVMGVNVSALIAGLGIMGFVVGFALKDTLGNLAAGTFILFHKPFRIGDFISVAGTSGTVKKIGISACTLESSDGVKITIPNGKIWGDTIKNYTGNRIRKIFNLEVGISYSDDISKAIKIINDILKKDKRVLSDPAPQVVTKSLEDSYVNIAIRPSVKKEDYWPLYFDLVKTIKEEFDKNNITIPFQQREITIKGWKKDLKRKKRLS